MHSTRREVLRSFAILGGSLVLARTLGACAAESRGDGSQGEADELVSCQPPVISNNHGHSLVVSPADVSAGVAKTCSIQGAAGHDHLVTITVAQFATLAAGGVVTTTSTSGAGHTHDVTITCVAAAAPTSDPTTCGNGAKASAISANHGHSLVISKADVAAGVATTYSIKGTATHDHQVSISAAQFASLKSGQVLTVTSTLTASHVHMVTIICA